MGAAVGSENDIRLYVAGLHIHPHDDSGLEGLIVEGHEIGRLRSRTACPPHTAWGRRFGRRRIHLRHGDGQRHRGGSGAGTVVGITIACLGARSASR